MFYEHTEPIETKSYPFERVKKEVSNELDKSRTLQIEKEV